MKLKQLSEDYTGKQLPIWLQELMDNFVEVFEDADGFHVEKESFHIPKIVDGKDDWEQSKNVVYWFIELKTDQLADKLKAWLKRRSDVVIEDHKPASTVCLYKIPRGWTKDMLKGS